MSVADSTHSLEEGPHTPEVDVLQSDQASLQLDSALASDENEDAGVASATSGRSATNCQHGAATVHMNACRQSRHRRTNTCISRRRRQKADHFYAPRICGVVAVAMFAVGLILIIHSSRQPNKTHSSSRSQSGNRLVLVGAGAVLIFLSLAMIVLLICMMFLRRNALKTGQIRPRSNYAVAEGNVQADEPKQVNAHQPHCHAESILNSEAPPRYMDAARASSANDADCSLSSVSQQPVCDHHRYSIDSTCSSVVDLSVHTYAMQCSSCPPPPRYDEILE